MLAIIIVWTKRNYKLTMLGVISKSVSQRIIKIAVVYWSQVKSATPKSEINRQSRPI